MAERRMRASTSGTEGSAGPAKATRRRGEALETSLLEAAWDVLVQSGSGGFTMDAVAVRARTSRPVLYRRWSSASDLAVDAIRHRIDARPVALPDTGDVRDDLVALIDGIGKQRAEMVVLFSIGAASHFDGAPASFAELMRKLFAGRPSLVRQVLDRGVARGQIDGTRLTPRIVALPMNLLRYEVYTTLKPVPRKVVEEIVDEIFLPLVRPARPSGGPAAV